MIADTIKATATLTAPIIKGGTIEIGSNFTVDSNGNVVGRNSRFYSVTAEGGTFKNVLIEQDCTIRGTLDGADGNFSGTVIADKIIGDIVSGISKSVVVTSQQNVGISGTALTASVVYSDSKPRTLSISGLVLTFYGDALVYEVSLSARVRITFGSNTVYSGVYNFFMNGTGPDDRYTKVEAITVPTLLVGIPANAIGYLRASVEMVSRSVSRYDSSNYVTLSAPSQVAVMMFRTGNGLA